MNRALRMHGAPARGKGVAFRAQEAARAFTLFEMCIVLMIMAILAFAMLPALFSTVNEHHVREDGHQLALMVRTAMIQCAEQHRPYVIDLTKNSMSLHPQGELAKPAEDSDAQLFQDAGTTNQSLADNVTMDVERQQDLDPANKLQVPDAVKVNSWTDITKDGLSWVFQPGELCPATKVRVARGDAYLELSFEALTGAVTDEKYYFP